MDTATYLWKERPRGFWWRIQTRNPKVINKLNRREDVSICGYGLNDSLKIFRIRFKSTRNARKSLNRLTGQKIYKDPLTDGFYSKSIPISTINKEGVKE